MSKHTPGPWTVDDDMGVYAEISGAMVCNVHEADDFPCIEGGTEADVQAECEANARLIAAAPDLLTVAGAALFVLRIVYQREPGTNEAGAIAELERAIALATVQP